MVTRTEEPCGEPPYPERHSNQDRADQPERHHWDNERQQQQQAREKAGEQGERLRQQDSATNCHGGDVTLGVVGAHRISFRLPG
jgi:hypothetical protein